MLSTKFSFILILYLMHVNNSGGSLMTAGNSTATMAVPNAIPPSMKAEKNRLAPAKSELNLKKSSPAATNGTPNQQYDGVFGLTKVESSIISGRIIGGTTVSSISEFPWQAFLSMDRGRGPESSCGGSLIDSQWVLTAAHCLNGGWHSVTVYLGTLNAKSNNQPNRLIVKSNQFVIHPQYSQASHRNDVALIKLPVPVKFNSFISPIRLPNSNDPLHVGDNVVLTGWGLTRDDPNSASPSLLKARSYVIPNDKCKKLYPNVDAGNICTLGARTGGTCRGDSGGPLNLRNADGTWTVIGIVSYGHGQCTIGWHDVYAKVSFYLNWIYSYVKTSPQRPPANQRFRNSMPALMSSESIKPRNSIQLPVNYSDGENVSLSLPNSTADAARMMPNTIPPWMMATLSEQIQADLAETELKMKTSPLVATNETNQDVVYGLANDKLPSSISGRIIGGTMVSSMNEFPWQVYLLVEKSAGAFVCGGSLIDSQWVLTAAHCLHGGARSVTIYLGSLNVMNRNDPNRVTLRTNQYYMHPQYNPQSLRSDIALIRLPYPVRFNNNIRPIRLPDANDPHHVNDIVTLTGWGRIRDDPSSASPSLLKTRSPVISTAQCRRAFHQVDDGNICILGDRSGATCQGDSGGPMNFQKADRTWIVIGIVSYGGRSCTVGMPDVFTRVRYYLNWIHSFVRPNQNANNPQRAVNQKQPIRKQQTIIQKRPVNPIIRKRPVNPKRPIKG